MTGRDFLSTEQKQQVQAWLAHCDGLLVCAGAGMGVDSGLPDFRGHQGFWRAYPALHGRDFAEVACPDTFTADLALAWGFYGHRLRLYRDTVPHAGFAQLRDLGARLPQGLFVFTSNVDGQFQKAGFDPARLVECHGSIHRLQCIEPCTDAVWPAHGFVPHVDERACRLLCSAPVCLHCGAPARPNILMFGDSACVMNEPVAQQERLRHWLGTVKRPLVVELGAGTAIPSVRKMAEWSARRGHLIRINPRESSTSGGHAQGWPVGAAAGVAQLVALS